MIKAVFIDIDNTLLDFDAYVQKAMKDGFELFDICVYDDAMYQVFKRINGELWRRIENGELAYQGLMRDRWNIIFSALNISFDGPTFEKYFQSCLFDSAIAIDGAESLLAYIKERYILCAASNGPYDQQVNRLKQGKMLSYFDKVFISEKIGVSKPSRQFFNRCLSELNAEITQQGKQKILPKEVIMIGDSLSSDMTGAITSGFMTCFFDKNKSRMTNDLHIDYVVDKLDDIRKLL